MCTLFAKILCAKKIFAETYTHKTEDVQEFTLAFVLRLLTAQLLNIFICTLVF